MSADTVMITVRKGDDVLADLLESNGNLPAAMVVRGREPVVYLWRLSQTVADGYDTYDSCVVAAVDEWTARRIHPARATAYCDERGLWVGDGGIVANGGDWVHPEQVTAVCIGATTTEKPGTIVCASFNAG